LLFSRFKSSKNREETKANRTKQAKAEGKKTQQQSPPKMQQQQEQAKPPTPIQ